MPCKLSSRSGLQMNAIPSTSPGDLCALALSVVGGVSDSDLCLTHDSTVHGCPHHPSSVSWYWGSKCSQCSGSIAPDDSEYRFARWPRNDCYSLSLNRLPPVSNEGPKTEPATRRQRRRSIAAHKYPYTYPRKGSDTNPSTLTGRVLSIYREGLSTIGRTFSVSPTSTPWKC